jgi:hypothetical protein
MVFWGDKKHRYSSNCSMNCFMIGLRRPRHSPSTSVSRERESGVALPKPREFERAANTLTLPIVEIQKLFWHYSFQTDPLPDSIRT